MASSKSSRVLTAVGAVAALGYTVLVPSLVFFASIGSWECLGSRCDAGNVALIVGMVAGYAAGLSAVVLLTVLSLRPRRGTFIASLTALLLAALAFVVQIWGASTVSSGGRAGAEAMQSAVVVDQILQQAFADTTGMSVWSTPGVTGPDVRVVLCPDDPERFQAMSSLTFDVVTGLPKEVREAIVHEVEVSTTALQLLPDVDLRAIWTRDHSRWVLTVSASCTAITEGT